MTSSDEFEPTRPYSAREVGGDGSGEEDCDDCGLSISSSSSDTGEDVWALCEHMSAGMKENESTHFEEQFHLPLHHRINY